MTKTELVKAIAKANKITNTRAQSRDGIRRARYRQNGALPETHPQKEQAHAIALGASSKPVSAFLGVGW